MGYKVNLWRPITFLCTSDEQVEFAMENTMVFTLVSPNMKHLGINLKKCEQGLYEKNNKTLMKINLRITK